MSAAGGIVKAQQEYATSKNLAKLFEDLTTAIIYARPADAAAFVAEEAARMASAREAYRPAAGVVDTEEAAAAYWEEQRVRPLMEVRGAGCCWFFFSGSGQCWNRGLPSPPFPHRLFGFLYPFSPRAPPATFCSRSPPSTPFCRSCLRCCLPASRRTPSLSCRRRAGSCKCCGARQSRCVEAVVCAVFLARPAAITQPHPYHLFAQPTCARPPF